MTVFSAFKGLLSRMPYSAVLGGVFYGRAQADIPRGKHTYGPEPHILGVPSLAEGSRIGSFCSIAPGLEFIFRGKHMTNWVSTYPFRAKWEVDVPLNDLPEHDPIVVGNDVWIATNVKIMQGVIIGDGAVIATESFVTKDVPPYAIVGGHPAQVIRFRFSERQIADLLRISWWNWHDDEIRKVVPLLMSDDIERFIETAKEMGKYPAPHHRVLET